MIESYRYDVLWSSYDRHKNIEVYDYKQKLQSIATAKNPLFTLWMTRPLNGEVQPYKTLFTVCLNKTRVKMT